MWDLFGHILKYLVGISLRSVHRFITHLDSFPNDSVEENALTTKGPTLWLRSDFALSRPCM